MIANDRRANALQIYLSKPLTRGEYIFGKLAILMAFLLFITWIPGVLLLVIQIVFAGNFTFFRNNVYLFPAITLFAVLDLRRGVGGDARALLALEEQPLRRRSSTPR